eukprot:395299-Pleurochrysis_carterae.AAC.1
MSRLLGAESSLLSGHAPSSSYSHWSYWSKSQAGLYKRAEMFEIGLRLHVKLANWVLLGQKDFSKQ